jgi:hypothetical protein
MSRVELVVVSKALGRSKAEFVAGLLERDE